MMPSITAKTITLEQNQKLVVQDVMFFRPFDWTAIAVIAFDWVSNNACHAMII